MSTERKPIPGFDNYEIGTDGVITKDSLKIATQFRDGRLCVSLRRDGKQHLRRVARLVLDVYDPIPASNLRSVQHQNDNPRDCRFENLRWGGHIKPRSKLTESDVREIRAQWRSSNDSYRKIASEYGVCLSSIGAIINEMAWCHVRDV